VCEPKKKRPELAPGPLALPRSRHAFAGAPLLTVCSAGGEAGALTDARAAFLAFRVAAPLAREAAFCAAVRTVTLRGVKPNSVTYTE
jgi:hypothetical protein